MPFLDTARIRLAALMILAVSLVLLVISFATSEGGGRTRFGSDLGADYAGFYTAGWMLNHYPAADLYDTDTQDRVHHELHPHLGPHEKLPYVHPPLVAWAFRPLALLPYPWSFAVWLVISLGLYLTGLLLTLRTTTLTPGDRLTVLLVAPSFEPFVTECWLGGQLSAVAFCCLAVTVAFDRAGRPLASGMALGLALYKPTLLLVILPVLVVARRWWALAGVTLTGMALAGLTLAAVGWEGSRAFLDKLLGFTGTATQVSGLELRTWKYVDFNAFTRLLVGPGVVQRLCFLALALPTLAIVLGRAWQLGRGGLREGRLLWAIALLATPVLNVYVGIYDSVLAVLGALVLIDALGRPAAQLPAGLQFWLVALYVTPWFTQPLAQSIHLQLFTLVVLGLVVWTCFFSDRKYT